MQYSPNVRVLTLGEASTFITLQSLQQQPQPEAPAATKPIDREAATVFVTSPGRSAMLPLVTLRCDFCGGLVDVVHGNLGVTDTFGVSRVNGDSKYGYEPYHLACLPF